MAAVGAFPSPTPTSTGSQGPWGPYGIRLRLWPRRTGRPSSTWRARASYEACSAPTVCPLVHRPLDGWRCAPPGTGGRYRRSYRTTTFRWPITSWSPSTWPRIAVGAGRSSKDGIRKAASVSGEILLLDGPGGSASRLVGALHTLTQEVPSSEFALIGGLAVVTRLGRVHRVTDDLDAAAQSVDGGPSRLSILVGGGESGRARHPIEGVKVDCIDVGSIPAADLDPGELPEDQFDRAFILAHRWALDSATPASLTVVSGEQVPVATVTCRVATPAALVAMKLQSAPRRRAEQAHKGPNDYGDLYACLPNQSRWPGSPLTCRVLPMGSASGALNASNSNSSRVLPGLPGRSDRPCSPTLRLPQTSSRPVARC